jgi:hypothetical protein
MRVLPLVKSGRDVSCPSDCSKKILKLHSIAAVLDAFGGRPPTHRTNFLFLLQYFNRFVKRFLVDLLNVDPKVNLQHGPSS